MKTKLILYMLLGLVVGNASGEEAARQRPEMLAAYKEIQKQPWLSCRVSLNWWLGDYFKNGPAILLRKSKDDSIIVSWDEDSEADGLPIVSRVSSKGDGEKLKDALLELFGKALQESVKIKSLTDAEVKAFTEKHPGHTPPYAELKIQVTGPDLKTSELITRLDIDSAAGDPDNMDIPIIRFLHLAHDLKPKEHGGNSEKGAVGKTPEAPQPPR